MHVAMFTSNYPPHPGGLEAIVGNLAVGFARQHRVTVCAAAWGGARGTDRSGTLTVHRVPTVHGAEALGVPYPVPLGPGLRRAIGDMRRPDVILTQGALYVTSVLACTLGRRWNVPVVLTEHVGFVEYGSAALNAVERAAWRAVGDRVVGRAAAVVTYNVRVERWVRTRVPHADVRYIANGVDASRFEPTSDADRARARQRFGLPPAGRLALFAARDSKKKNLDAVLRMPRADHTLVVCGADRGLRLPGVIDLGVVPHARMPELLAAVDALVHAATGEGFPLAVQEALAAGVPVVLLWEAGYAGAVGQDAVAACDTLDQMPAALARVLGDPDARAAQVRAARAWALTHWSWARTVAQYEALFAETVARHRTHA